MESKWENKWEKKGNAKGKSNGKTSSDVERILAFDKIGLKDPIESFSAYYWYRYPC